MFGSKKALDRIFGGLEPRRQRLSAGEVEKAETGKGAFRVSRRSVVAAAAGGMAVATAAHAASFGNPDDPPQGAINARNPASLRDPGPQNPAIADQFPSSGSPPATDVGDLQQCAEADPERRLGAAGDAGGFPDRYGDLGCRYAAHGWRHPRAPLAS